MQSQEAYNIQYTYTIVHKLKCFVTTLQYGNNIQNTTLYHIHTSILNVRIRYKTIMTK